MNLHCWDKSRALESIFLVVYEGYGSFVCMAERVGAVSICFGRERRSFRGWLMFRFSWRGVVLSCGIILCGVCAIWGEFDF